MDKKEPYIRWAVDMALAGLVILITIVAVIAALVGFFLDSWLWFGIIIIIGLVVSISLYIRANLNAAKADTSGIE